jgi:hypothetical protein
MLEGQRFSKWVGACGGKTSDAWIAGQWLCVVLRAIECVPLKQGQEKLGIP